MRILFKKKKKPYLFYVQDQDKYNQRLTSTGKNSLFESWMSDEKRVGRRIFSSTRFVPARWVAQRELIRLIPK